MYKKAVIVLGTTVLASGVLLGAQAPGQPATSSPTQSTSHDKSGAVAGDQAFITEAMRGGMAEVELGKLASQKATNDKVKTFGQRMVTDHGKAGDELKSLAASKQITVPTSIDAKHQATIDKFARLSGAEFDRAYVRDMVADHKKDVAAFDREAMSGKDSDVKAWAAKTLPTLREHLRMIEEIDKEMTASHSTR
jgi:putative membrane protein